jgi:hypothetical protein
MADLEGMALAIINGKRDEVKEKVQQMIDEGVSTTGSLRACRLWASGFGGISFMCPRF